MPFAQTGKMNRWAMSALCQKQALCLGGCYVSRRQRPRFSRIRERPSCRAALCRDEAMPA